MAWMYIQKDPPRKYLAMPAVPSRAERTPGAAFRPGSFLFVLMLCLHPCEALLWAPKPSKTANRNEPNSWAIVAVQAIVAASKAPDGPDCLTNA